MDLHSLALSAFYLFLIPVSMASVLYYLLGMYYVLTGGNEKDKEKGIQNLNNDNEIDKNSNNNSNLPYVTIQIPVYNDGIVVRCIKHCVNFDYPKDKYEIQVVDDSNDKKVIEAIDACIERYKNLLKISVVRRNNRNGFKPGALNNAMRYAKGEIIVLFDSDFAPEKEFLKTLIAPIINDKNIAAVQARMGFLNANKNIITKFAAGILMVYNTIVLRITSKKGITFLEGTGLAVRTNTLKACGNWNEKSITEDADLTLVLLEKGYKIKFLYNLINPGEVPFTLRSFLRQQMRWSYGMIRVGIEHRNSIFSDKFSLTQKILISLILFTSFFSFFVIGMTFSALLAAITGIPTQLMIEDVIRFLAILILTFGFGFSMLLVLRKEESLGNFPALILAVFFIGIILSIAVSVATIKASANKKMWWHRTQKSELVEPG